MFQNASPTIYDPQLRSFIKKPETKLCITCGQPLAPDVKPMTNVMNNYLNPISGNTVTIASKEDTLEIQGVLLYRCDTDPKTGTPIKIDGKYVSSLIPKSPLDMVNISDVPVVEKKEEEVKVEKTPILNAPVQTTIKSI